LFQVNVDFTIRVNSQRLCIKVKSKFIKRHKNYTISTVTEALATLWLASHYVLG